MCSHSSKKIKTLFTANKLANIIEIRNYHKINLVYSGFCTCTFHLRAKILIKKMFNTFYVCLAKKITSCFEFIGTCKRHQNVVFLPWVDWSSNALYFEHFDVWTVKSKKSHLELVLQKWLRSEEKMWTAEWHNSRKTDSMKKYFKVFFWSFVLLIFLCFKDHNKWLKIIKEIVLWMYVNFNNKNFKILHLLFFLKSNLQFSTSNTQFTNWN